MFHNGSANFFLHLFSDLYRIKNNKYQQKDETAKDDRKFLKCDNSKVKLCILHKVYIYRNGIDYLMIWQRNKFTENG